MRRRKTYTVRRYVNPYAEYVSYSRVPRGRGYGLSNLVGDVVLTVFTGGAWAIWWIIREVSN